MLVVRPVSAWALIKVSGYSWNIFLKGSYLDQFASWKGPICGGSYLVLRDISVCRYPICSLDRSRTLQKSQIRGHRLGTVAPSAVHAFAFYRALGSAFLSLVDFHRLFLTHALRGFRAEFWKKTEYDCIRTNILQL